MDTRRFDRAENVSQWITLLKFNLWSPSERDNEWVETFLTLPPRKAQLYALRQAA